MKDKLPDNLCGFREGFSTQYALLKFIENWHNLLDNKNIVGVVISCNLSEALHLTHDLLIAKLEAYGFGHILLKLIYANLSDRKQRCKVGSCYITWLDILTGGHNFLYSDPYYLTYYSMIFSISSMNLKFLFIKKNTRRGYFHT